MICSLNGKSELPLELREFLFRLKRDGQGQQEKPGFINPTFQFVAKT